MAYSDHLDDHLPVPDLLDDHDLIQNGPGRDEGKHGPVVGFHAKMAWLALAGSLP